MHNFLNTLFPSRIFLFSLLYLIILCGTAQTSTLDSLIKDFNTARHDTTRATAYIEMTEILYLSNPDTVITLCAKAIELADKNLAGKLNEAEKESFLKVKASAFNNTGYIYQSQGNIIKGLDFYHKATKIQEMMGDEKELAQSLNNIGFIYFGQKDVAKALYYYEKSLQIRQKLNDKRGLAEVYNNIGLTYKKYGDPGCKSLVKDSCLNAGVDRALVYYEKSLKLREEINDKVGIGTSLNNIGGVYRSKGELDKALDYFTRSLDYRKATNDKSGMCIGLNNIGSVYIRKKNLPLAEEYTVKSLELARSLGFPDNIRQSADQLKVIYTAREKYKEAMEMLVLVIKMRDTLNNITAQKEAERQHVKFQYERKAIADSVSSSHEKELLETRLEKEQTREYALYIGLVLVLIFSAFIFNRFKISQKQKHLIEIKEKETQQQKKLLELKQKEIVDSINYAHRIQKALLASESLLKNNLPEHFIFYKPKDIVSGDFYWASALGNGGFSLIAADSTGHGVPGAFMSLLNISFLNEAINERKLSDPGQVLNHTRQRIIQSLSEDGSVEGGKDGMDCSLICLDIKTSKLSYAAANNPVWIVRSGAILELEPDKMPIGKHDKDHLPFTSRDFIIQKDDLIILLTDGYADQFGGPSGKKFKYRKLQELITENSHLNMEELKKILSGSFESWKGNNEQVDDVLLIGIRV